MLEACFASEKAKSIGHQPLPAIIASSGLVAGSTFRYGNESPQVGLVEFVHQCEQRLPDRIRIVRSDSAAYNSAFFNDCFACHRLFTVTADHDIAVMNALATIPQCAWKQGVFDDGTLAPWEVAETIHTMEKTTDSFQLVVKRTLRKHQTHLFDGIYTYWIVATNISVEEMSANAVILFHQQRGEMERIIGELKHHFNLDHLPCGQFDANALYFTTGILAYNIIQLIKQITLGNTWMKKSIRTLRYKLYHLAARVIHHARGLIVRVASTADSFNLLTNSFYTLRLAPWPPW
ncbi:MAG: transposase [bacterium]